LVDKQPSTEMTFDVVLPGVRSASPFEASGDPVTGLWHLFGRTGDLR